MVLVLVDYMYRCQRFAVPQSYPAADSYGLFSRVRLERQAY